MERTQIYNIVNSMYKQATGKENVIETNAQFIDTGRKILSSDTNKEQWYKVLVDRITRTVNSVREYHAINAELKREPIEYGAVLQKLSMPLIEAKENTSWRSQDDEHSDPYRKSKITPIQTFFTGGATWEFDSTIPDVQLETAFTSPEAMAAFIDMIFLTVYNSMEVAFQNNANLCRASFIVRKVGTVGFIDVLSEYKKINPDSTLTKDTCIYDRDFLQFLVRCIKLYADRMPVMSGTFNNEDMDRHTPKQLQIVNVLADIESSFVTILESNTFHDDLVKLTDYNVVPYWQGSGKTWSFEDVSSVNVIPKGTETGVKVSGIVAMIYDHDAMGITIDKRRTKSIYNPADEYTNYFAKADINYYNDMSENGIVFTLETPENAAQIREMLSTVKTLTQPKAVKTTATK